MRLVDFGCGAGSLTCGFARLVAPGEVLGVDGSEDAISKARALADQSRLLTCSSRYLLMKEGPQSVVEQLIVYALAIVECVFRGKPNADFGVSRTRISVDAEHRFRPKANARFGMPNTHFG
jgi:hypothetical protein